MIQGIEAFMCVEIHNGIVEQMIIVQRNMTTFIKFVAQNVHNNILNIELLMY